MMGGNFVPIILGEEALMKVKSKTKRDLQMPQKVQSHAYPTIGRKKLLPVKRAEDDGKYMPLTNAIQIYLGPGQ